MGGVIKAEIGQVWQCIDGLSERSQTLSHQLQTLTREGTVAEATGPLQASPGRALKTFTHGPVHSRCTRYLATSSTRAIYDGGYPEQNQDCNTSSVSPLTTVYRDLASEEEAQKTLRHVSISPCELRGDATWDNWERRTAAGDPSEQMGRGEEGRPRGAGAGVGGGGGGRAGDYCLSMPLHRHLSMQELRTDSRSPISLAHSGLF